MFDLGATLQAASSTALLAEPMAYAGAALSEKFGAHGTVQLAVGVVIGGGLGAGGYIAQLGVPGDFATWFALIIWTLIAAFVPAGVYEANKKAATKGAKQAAAG